jgi:hypothetical protein
VTFSKQEKDAELAYHLLPEHTQQAMLINAFSLDEMTSATFKLVVVSITSKYSTGSFKLSARASQHSTNQSFVGKYVSSFQLVVLKFRQAIHQGIQAKLCQTIQVKFHRVIQAKLHRNQVTPATICNDSFELIDMLASEGAALCSEGAQPAPTILCNKLCGRGLIVDFICNNSFKLIDTLASEGAQFAQIFYQPGNLDSSQLIVDLIFSIWSSTNIIKSLVGSSASFACRLINLVEHNCLIGIVGHCLIGYIKLFKLNTAFGHKELIELNNVGSSKLIVSKISLHFCKDCGLFCEGEWEHTQSVGFFDLISFGLFAEVALWLNSLAGFSTLADCWVIGFVGPIDIIGLVSQIFLVGFVDLGGIVGLSGITGRKSLVGVIGLGLVGFIGLGLVGFIGLSLVSLVGLISRISLIGQISLVGLNDLIGQIFFGPINQISLDDSSASWNHRPNSLIGLLTLADCWIVGSLGSLSLILAL